MSNPVFIIAAGLLVVATAAYVLQPLWRGQRAVALSLAALLATGSIGLYLWLGTPMALDPAARKPPETIEQAIAQLQQALKRSPEHAEGWRLLGRQHVRIGQREPALQAFDRALQLEPDNPDLLAEAAEARALLDPQRRFDEQAARLLQRALTIDARHPRALLFTGVMHRQGGRPADAAAVWESLLPDMEGAAAEQLRAQINDARADAQLPPLPASDPATASAGAHAIPVHVEIAADPSQIAQLPADTTVFVIARLPDGPPMPIAVQRHRLDQLPLRLTLGDGDSPMPTARLSMVPEVEVIARISPSGNASRQPEDIETAPVRIRLPATGTVELLISNPR